MFLARTNAELTQQQVADRCGVSKSLISEIENGTRNARLAMIRKLAAAVGCRVEDLERKREPEATPPADVDLPEQGLRSGERADADQVLEVRN